MGECVYQRDDVEVLCEVFEAGAALQGNGLWCVWQQVEVVVGDIDLAVAEGEIDAAGEYLR